MTHPTNETLIQELLKKKETATPDEARKIRSQLRKLGYSLRGQGNTDVLPTGETRVKATRRNNSHVKTGDVIPRSSKHVASPTMTPEEILVLKDILKEQYGLIERKKEEIKENEHGYGFDLHTGVQAGQFMEKFTARWATESDPEWRGEWFIILGEETMGVKILMVGPLTKK